MDGPRNDGDGNDREGVSYVHVFPTRDDEGYCFTYSVGLQARGLPEIVVYGLDARTSQGVLEQAVVAMGPRLGTVATREPVDGVLVGYPVALGDAEVTSRGSEGHYVPLARHASGGDSVTVRQVFFPDAEGRFPWDPDCSPNIAATQDVANSVGRGPVPTGPSPAP